MSQLIGVTVADGPGSWVQFAGRPGTDALWIFGIWDGATVTVETKTGDIPDYPGLGVYGIAVHNLTFTEADCKAVYENPDAKGLSVDISFASRQWLRLRTENAGSETSLFAVVGV